MFSSQEQCVLVAPLINIGKPQINRLSTARCVPFSVYIEFSSFVILQRLVFDAFLLGELSCPTPLCCPAMRPDPTRLWYVRALESTGKRFIKGTTTFCCCWLFTSGPSDFRPSKLFFMQDISDQAQLSRTNVRITNTRNTTFFSNLHP